MNEANYCFVCSKINPKGIHLEIECSKGIALAKFSIEREYEGYPGIVHGGILASILDDVMGNIKFNEGYIAYTCELNIKYLKKCKIGENLFAKAWVKNSSHRIFETEGEITGYNGVLRVKAEAKYFIQGKYK